jgi:hypothetical protein
METATNFPRMGVRLVSTMLGIAGAAVVGALLVSVQRTVAALAKFSRTRFFVLWILAMATAIPNYLTVRQNSTLLTVIVVSVGLTAHDRVPMIGTFGLIPIPI